MDTYITTCSVCEEEMDMIAGTGKKPVCDDCMTADAYATAFMVLGVDKSKELLKKLPGIEVYFVYSNQQGEYEVFFSEGMKRMIFEEK